MLGCILHIGLGNEVKIDICGSNLWLRTAVPVFLFKTVDLGKVSKIKKKNCAA